jgi:trimeric autotransporter adhesin
MTNVVEIVVKATNLTGKTFAEVDAAGANLGKTFSKVGTIGTVAMAAIGVASIKMAATFQSTMTTLVTQALVSKNQLGVLEKGVLSLAGKVGFSPNSLGQALYHVESSFQSIGITAPKALNLLRIAAEGAAVGHANLVDVTNALDATIASGIPGVKNYSQAMGVLNAIVGTGDMTMQDLADAMGTGMVAVVKGFGLSIKDVGAALATFGDNNIRGARAGTDLRMAVQALANPVKAGKDQLLAWGYSTDRLSKDMQQGGLLKALLDLNHMFQQNGVTAKQQGQIITDMFGKRAGVGLAVLMDQLGRVQSKYPDLTKAATGFGNAWATTQQTATQKFNQLKASLDSAAISLGNKLLPAATTLLNFVSAHISGIERFALALGAIAVAGKTIQMIRVGFQLIGTAASWMGRLLSGTTQSASVQIGASAMQKAADTMVLAAEAMQKAADTMVGADTAAAGGATGAAGGAAAAGRAGLSAALGPVGAGVALGLGINAAGSQLTKNNPVTNAAGAAAANRLGMISGTGQIVATVLNILNKSFSSGGSNPLLGGFKPGLSGPLITLKVQGDITDLSAKLAAARSDLAKTVNPQQKAKIRADISQLEAQLAKARAELNALNGQTAYTYVINTTSYRYNKNVTGKAAGGVMGAASGGVRGNMVMVGEYGRELVSLPPGSMVHSNPDTERMLAAGHGGSPTVVLQVMSGPNAAFDKFMSNWVANYVRVKGGGNVQLAFGRDL